MSSSSSEEVLWQGLVSEGGASAQHGVRLLRVVLDPVLRHGSVVALCTSTDTRSVVDVRCRR